MIKQKIAIICLLTITFFALSCQKKANKWEGFEKSITKWENFELQIKGIKAPFPERPVIKSIAYSSEVTFYQSYAEIDSVTFSVAIITNSALVDAKSWHNFLHKEVLAFKAIERKSIKVQSRDAVMSKVRENELCGYSVNMIVDNKFIANIAIRCKGDFPPEKLILDFASRLKIEKYQLPSNPPPVLNNELPLLPDKKQEN